MNSQVLVSVFNLILCFSHFGFSFELLPSPLQILSHSGQNVCRSHVEIYEENLHFRSLWALRMWDSSGKQPVGLLSGNQAQFGNFDECLSTEAPFPLQFCLARVDIVLKSDARNSSSGADVFSALTNDRSSMPRSSAWLGLCKPSSCNALSSSVISSKETNLIEWKINLLEQFCTSAVVEQSTGLSAILFWSVSALIVFAIMAASAVDIYFTTSGSKWELTEWLSLRSNFKRLVSPVREPNHPLAIFYGLRVAAVVIVLYAHRVGIPLSFSGFNHEEWEKTLRGTIFRFSAQADMTVDTFFFVSGVLMGYTDRPVHHVFSIVTRIFRLSPLYLWVIWFEASAMPNLGSGPLWNAVQIQESAVCSKYWWLNALFLQNYVNNDEMCLTHLWYIPCEFHFFLVTLILLPLIQKNRLIGISLTSFITALAVIMPAITTYLFHLEPLVLFYLPDFLSNPRGNKTFLEIYAKSHNRAAPYFIGFICGFYLFSNGNNVGKSNWKHSVGLLLTSLILLFIPMAYGVHFYNTPEWYILDILPFTSLRRPIWALGLLCLVLSHRVKPLPIVGSLLTCRAAAVLSRLSYGVYLIHFPIIMANMAKLRTPPVFNWFDVIFSGDLASCFIFSGLMFLFIEMPLKRLLTGICFPMSTKPKTPSNADTATTAV